MLLPLTLLPLLPCPKSPILLPLSLHLLYFLSLVFSSFISFLFPFLPIFFPPLPFSLLLSTSTALPFSALVSTASYIPLDISSSLPILFSNQFQSCNEQATASPKSCSMSVLQLHLSSFCLYALGSKYLLLLYT